MLEFTFLYCIDSPKFSKDFLLFFGPDFGIEKLKTISEDKKDKFDWAFEFMNFEKESNFFQCLIIFFETLET